jgi:hypothetical protein
VERRVSYLSGERMTRRIANKKGTRMDVTNKGMAYV